MGSGINADILVGDIFNVKGKFEASLSSQVVIKISMEIIETVIYYTFSSSEYLSLSKYASDKYKIVGNFGSVYPFCSDIH